MLGKDGSTILSSYFNDLNNFLFYYFCNFSHCWPLIPQPQCIIRAFFSLSLEVEHRGHKSSSIEVAAFVAFLLFHRGGNKIGSFFIFSRSYSERNIQMVKQFLPVVSPSFADFFSTRVHFEMAQWCSVWTSVELEVSLELSIWN